MTRDYGEKFIEYEKGGLKNWILDPAKERSVFPAQVKTVLSPPINR
jgi:hypothetical protein